MFIKSKLFIKTSLIFIYIWTTKIRAQINVLKMQGGQFHRQNNINYILEPYLTV
jgi:hypothetical protein